jgi:hypothetical protein
VVAKKETMSALVLAGRLQRMLRLLDKGDTRPELRDAIARLAFEMGVYDVEIDADVATQSATMAGPDRVDENVQDPFWRVLVRAAKGLEKPKKIP